MCQVELLASLGADRTKTSQKVASPSTKQPRTLAQISVTRSSYRGAFFVFVLRPIHRVQHRRSERYRSAAQDNTQTDMRYLGSRRACAAYHHAWPHTLHNKMIQRVNLPWPGNDLGTILGCGCLTVHHNEHQNQNQDHHPNKAHLKGATRLLQILLSESAFLIWALRCERVIHEKNKKLSQDGYARLTKDSLRIK